MEEVHSKNIKKYIFVHDFGLGRRNVTVCIVFCDDSLSSVTHNLNELKVKRAKTFSMEEEWSFYGSVYLKIEELKEKHNEFRKKERQELI